ncbi:MAG: acyl carrier protein [Bacteroidota bacterium]
MTVAERIATYIANELLGDPTTTVAADENLLLSGRLDSIGVISLVAFIESDLGVTVPPEDVIIDHFISIEAMVAYLAQREDAAPHA